jgi:S1-C subfamily serine protease
MKTVLASALSAAAAAVIAAVMVLAVDDDPTPPAAVTPDPSAVTNVERVEEPQSTPQPVAATTDETPTPVAEPEPVPSAASLIDEDFDPAAIYQQAGPSIVSVETDFGGGSGFFVDEDGHVVTNYHVIQGAREVFVVNDSGVRVAGEVLGVDTANDLAVIQVNPDEIAVHPITLGDSSQLRVGEPVVALGSPFGLEQTLTIGVVSAIERDRDALQLGGRPQRGLIQTDAAINPGNSGGALINADGEVIGITNSVESPIRGSVGVGFAIPSNILSRFLPTMIAGQDVEHPWVGIEASRTDELTVESVVAGAPAAQAGLLPGDRIVELDGAELVSFDQLVTELDLRDPGDVVAFTVERNEQTLQVDVTLGVWPG